MFFLNQEYYNKTFYSWYDVFKNWKSFEGLTIPLASWDHQHSVLNNEIKHSIGVIQQNKSFFIKWSTELNRILQKQVLHDIKNIINYLHTTEEQNVLKCQNTFINNETCEVLFKKNCW